jgi:hypothetical protein
MSDWRQLVFQDVWVKLHSRACLGVDKLSSGADASHGSGCGRAPSTGRCGGMTMRVSSLLRTHGVKSPDVMFSCVNNKQLHDLPN